MAFKAWFYMAICLILASGCQNPAYAMLNVDKLANAIYRAENSPKWPYGVKHHYKHTTPRQACINTIKHRLKAWNGKGDFIVFLGMRYSPPAINPNWVRLVHYFMERGNS